MIVVTESGSTYEVDELEKRVRRLNGKGNPTPRTGVDGEWKEYEWVSGIMIGVPLFIKWKHEKPKVEGAMAGTQTSRIVQILNDVN